MRSDLVRRGSAWDIDQIESFLAATVIPVRLAFTGTGGRPLLCSVWFCYEEGALWCATQKTARLAEALARHPECAFEVAGDTMPYRGVRGQGEARLDDDRGEEILRKLVERYLPDPESSFAEWLLGRADREVAIRIDPVWVTAWDFADRML